MKKFINILIVLAVSLTLVITASCSHSKPSSAKSDVASNLPKPGDFSKKLELSLSGSFTQGKIEDGNWVQKRLEKMFNIKIKNTKVNTWDQDQVSLMMASGDLPDTFSFTAGSQTPLELYQDGLTRTIPKKMIEKYAPRYAKMLDEHPPGWRLNLAPGKKDEYVALTGLQQHTAGILWAPTLRLDWMEKLGIKPPGKIKPVGPSGGRERIYFTDKAYTLKQLERILKAFTYDDPDGDGKNDTYGISPYNDSMNWAETLMGAYGIAPGYNLMEDGKLKPAEISNKYKEFLKTLARWNKEGLIDPEWTTLDTQKSWEKYKQGKIGYYTAQRAYLGMDDWTKGRAPQNLVVKDKNVKLLATAPEIGPNGQQGEGAYSPVTLLGGAFYVSKNVSDEKLARILQVFDYINFDDKARWTMYGKVGKHSYWEGTPGKSALKIKKQYPEQEGNMGFWAYNFRTYDNERVQWFTSEYTMNLVNNFFAKPEVLQKMEIQPYRYDLLDQTNLKELDKRYDGQLNTIVDEFRMKAITGQINIDKEWNNYVQDYLNNGGREIIKELEKAPKTSNLLKK